MRRVLAVARTVTSAVRLLDVLTVFEDDPRIQVVFTIDRDSAFNDGVEELLRNLGARVIAWDQAVATRFDLAIAASANGELHALRSPLVLVPHGAGYHKYRRPDIQGRVMESGLATEQLVHEGAVVPAAIVLSHPEQLERLRRTCPEAAPRAFVAGDVCFDRLVASESRREEYRDHLGVRDGRRLAVICSTWGGESLMGRHPELPARLLSELPVDEYRVAVVLHPNIWYGHGPWQVRGWLARARDAGVLLMRPEEGWRAALVAADCLIGDHGSVSLYGAALGRPVLLAAFGRSEIVPGTPMAALGRLCPYLDLGHPLRPQVEQVMGSAPPDAYAALAARTFAHRGQAAARLRDLLYGLMRLTPGTGTPRLRAVPAAGVEHRPVTALVVHTSGTDVIGISRFPAVLADTGRSPAAAGPRHLAVEVGELDPGLLESAAVLLARSVPSGSDHARYASGLLARYPGARLAAVVTAPDACLLMLRGVPPLTAHLSQPLDPTLTASAVYAHLTGGGTWEDLKAGLVLAAGDRRAAVRFADPSGQGPHAAR